MQVFRNKYGQGRRHGAMTIDRRGQRPFELDSFHAAPISTTLTSIVKVQVQTFYEVGSLNLTWCPDLRSHGVKIFTQCAKMLGEQVYKIYARRRFPAICEKNTGAKTTPPPPTRAKVN